MLTKEAIVKMLKEDDRAVVRALLVLNERQTTDEQLSEATRYLNGRGFRPCHARMGTSMATQFQNKGSLSIKQINYWRMTDRTGNMRLGIYWKQLAEAAEEKAKKKQAYIQQLEYELGMVLDSDDPKLIEPIAAKLRAAKGQ